MSRVPILAGVALVAVCGLLSGCSNSEVEVDLSGAEGLEVDVGACVALAGDGRLRPGAVTPTRIKIQVTSATQDIGETLQYVVDGTTNVWAPDEETYEWVCLTEITLSGPAELSARIVEFEKIN